MQGIVEDEAPWCRLHETVWLVHRSDHRRENDSAEEVKVVKVNKREVWVRTKRNTEHKFTPVHGRREMLQAPRAKGGFAPQNDELLAADDPRVVEILANQRYKGRKVLVERRCRSFLQNPGKDTAEELIDMLQAFIREIEFREESNRG